MLKADSRTLVLISFFSGITSVLIPISKGYYLVAFFLLFFIIVEEYKRVLKALGLYLILFGLELLITRYNQYLNFLHFLSIFSLKLYPIFVMGAFIGSIPSGELIRTLRQFKLPTAIVIPISVVFRWLPGIKSEIRAIREMMIIRGLKPSFSRIVVPVFMKSLTVSETLAASAYLRNIGKPGKKTVFSRSSFSIRDILILVIFIVTQYLIWRKNG